ncbi:MAG: Rnase Y domain-containing protein, partial [Acidobacteria bacterium]|nr:Rnase Y domain-containing protein [Acidobacteriota bacterium]
MQFLPGVAGAIAGAVAALLVFLAWFASRKRLAARTVGRASHEAARLTQEARREAEAASKETLLTARERAHELLREAETQIRDRRAKIADLDKQVADRARALADREAALKRAEASVRGREESVTEVERAAAAEEARCRELSEQTKRELQRVSGMTADEAKEVLLHQLESDARRDAANLVKRLEHEAREVAADKAKHIITQAIQRSAADHAIETTVSVVDLPSDDLKGRIIGREGRNIRALETATGVELIVDDTPGAIILSSFDPYRREIAKVSIERLIADGRIHPARIEEVVERVRSEVDEAVLKEGEAAAFELGLHD